MLEKKTTSVKSVTLGDVKAADAKTGVKTTASAQRGTTEVKDLDRDIKDLDRKEKTASSKELDKRAKQADKVDKRQNP